jgi:hypothetical protein
MPDKREIRGPIRVGIVGLGNWAKYGHIPVLNLLPHYKLSTIYSQRRDAAESAVAEYGLTCVANTLDELVNHPEVDLPAEALPCAITVVMAQIEERQDGLIDLCHVNVHRCAPVRL